MDPDRDACTLTEWMTGRSKCLYGIHPHGFAVFLDHTRVDACDEYKRGDPYGIEDNIDSSFQKARIANTISLVRHITRVSGNDLIRILDIGCGQGYISTQIRRAFPQCAISAVDLSISAIEKARVVDSNIDFIVADANDLPYPPGSFDCLIMNNIWEHLTDPLGLLINAKRVLKDKGYLILSTPSRYRFSNLIRALRGKQLVISPHHITEYTIGQVKEQLRFAGFETIRTISSDTSSRHGSISPSALASRLVRAILTVLLGITRSHHLLNSTAFFLAVKQNG